MPPQAYVVGAGIAWNYARDLDGKVTICQWLRQHPFVTTAALAWFIPHYYRGTHLTDRAVRVLGRLRR